MSDTPLSTRALPDWVRRLGVATWVSDPQGRIVYANDRMENVFGRQAEDIVGTPCHDFVKGRNAEGERFCKMNCSVTQAAAAGEEIEPYTLRVEGADEKDRWLQLLVIPFEVEGQEGRYLAHCAFRVDRKQLIESFLDRVASRTPINEQRRFDLEKSRLSRREREVLALLAEDENLYSIAEKLNVSYYTVRNHVQHILGKMGVHSTLEAIALYLLSQAEESESSGSPGERSRPAGP